MAGCVHAVLCYFEWTAAKDNWADGVSRYGADDLWLTRSDINCFVIQPFLFLLRVPPLVVGRVYSFL